MLYQYRFIWMMMFALMVLLLGYYYFLKPVINKYHILSHKKVNLLQQWQQIQRPHIVSVAQKSTVDTAHLIDMFALLQIQSMLQSAEDSKRFDFILQGSCAHWHIFLNDWRNKNFVGFIEFFELEKFKDNLKGKLSVSFFPEEGIKNNNLLAQKIALSAICLPDLSVNDQQDIALRSFSTMRMVGSLTIDKEENRLVAWEDGRTFLLKKGDQCCVEHLTVVAFFKDRIVFRDPNGRMIKKSVS